MYKLGVEDKFRKLDYCIDTLKNLSVASLAVGVFQYNAAACILGALLFLGGLVLIDYRRGQNR